MAYQTVTCEVYYKITVNEVYSELRRVTDYSNLEFESQEDANRFLAEEGYTREEPGSGWWKKHQTYREAYVVRVLRELKE